MRETAPICNHCQRSGRVCELLWMRAAIHPRSLAPMVSPHIALIEESGTEAFKAHEPHDVRSLCPQSQREGKNAYLQRDTKACTVVDTGTVDKYVATGESEFNHPKSERLSFARDAQALHPQQPCANSTKHRGAQSDRRPGHQASIMLFQ